MRGRGRGGLDGEGISKSDFLETNLCFQRIASLLVELYGTDEIQKQLIENLTSLGFFWIVQYRVQCEELNKLRNLLREPGGHLVIVPAPI